MGNKIIKLLVSIVIVLDGKGTLAVKLINTPVTKVVKTNNSNRVHSFLLSVFDNSKGQRLG